MRVRHVLTNTAAQPYLVEELSVLVPVPDRVSEQLDCTGRHTHERVPQRREIASGVWLREGRGGRPGFESPTLLVAGTAGFGFRQGEVWAVHVGWSGNARYLLERRPSGFTVLGAGELLLPGEVVLLQSDTYATPWVYLVSSRDGLDGLSRQLHTFQRSLPAHPNSPRPVTLNTWEAVYFDHDLGTLESLAERAAAIGAERFVLDDGWFGSRRDPKAGLGDWVVSADAWPRGLHPLVAKVQTLGMQFGIWFEPEMVNPDSELYRHHPDWILSTGGRVPMTQRHQFVLDLSRDDVRDHLLGQLDAVLSEYPIDYVKWDHNRDLVDAGGARAAGAAVVHAHTLGYYSLLDELRRRHPGVEWESCASGGARIDLGVIERVQRFWTSDLTDPLGRQLLQRWTQLLIAPEYLGAHVCAPVNHTTGRTTSLDFRAATAFFLAMGVEWDLTRASAAELDRLGRWIALHKQHRPLLHRGESVRVDLAEPLVLIHGVVAADRSAAIFAYVQLDDLVTAPPPFLLAGLDPRRRYQVTRVHPDPGDGAWRADGLELSGQVLHAVGLPAPPRRPMSADIVHLRAYAD